MDFISLFFLLATATSRHITYHQAATINFNAFGTVVDQSNYPIDGVNVLITLGTSVLGQAQTKTDGSFSVTGQMPVSPAYQVNFMFCIVSPQVWSQNVTVKGVQSGNTVNFEQTDQSLQGKFFINVNDMTGSEVVRAQIQVSNHFYHQGSAIDLLSKPVPNAQILITIYAQKQTSGFWVQNFTITSDQEGNFNARPVIPYSTLVAGGYVASSEGYFDTIQMDVSGNPALTLAPSNKFTVLNWKVVMVGGTIQQVITGIIFSADTQQALIGAAIEMSYYTFNQNKNYTNVSSTKTTAGGVFTATLAVPIYNCQFYLEISTAGYKTKNFTFTQNYNFSNSKIDTYTYNVPKITLDPDIKFFTINTTGQLIGPLGNPEPGISVQFNTVPQTTSLTCQTDATGKFLFEDDVILPNVSTQFTVTVHNKLNQIQTFSLTEIPKANNTIVSFGNLDYQDFVNASISGEIQINKVPLTTPVTLLISCPDSLSPTGKPVNVSFQSTSQAQFTGVFQVLAENDKSITCQLIIPATQEFTQESMSVVLPAPTFKTQNIILNGDYNKVYLVLKGQVDDALNLIPFVPKANISLILSTPDPISNNLTTEADASGNFQFNFTGVQGQIYQGFLNVTDAPNFNYSLVPIKLDCTKNATVVQNVSLQRTIIQAYLQSQITNVNKIPYPNTTISLISENPNPVNQTLAQDVTLDQANGSFSLPFKCYENVNTTVTINVSIPTYVPIIEQQLFNCSQPVISLVPFQLSPQKVNVTSTISGKIINPSGQPIPNQQVILVTNPQSVNLTNKTGVDGSFEFVNQYTQPNTNYSFELFVLNGLNQNQTWSVNGTPVNNASSFAFGTLDLQQLVNASISGQVDVNNVTDTTPVVLQVSCPSTLGADGKPINTTVTSNTSGGFNLSFGVLAENDKPVNCSVTFPGSTEYAQKSINVTLSPPTFKSSGILLPGEYNQVLLTIKGTVTDAANLVPAVQKANVTLILNSTDPLSNNLTTLTDASGNYQFNFSGVAGQIYNATINVTDSPQFNSSSTPIKLDCTKNATIQQYVVLQREILEATFLSQLVNELKQPIVNATLTLTSESPSLPPALALQSSVKDQANGSFALPFKCYADVNTTLTVTIQIPTYDNVQYLTQPFNCQNQSFSLPQLVVTPSKTNVTSILTGKVIDPFGAPVANLQMNLTTNPFSVQLSNKTLADGSFVFVNQYTQPNETYIFQLDLINNAKQNQTFNLTGTPTQNISTFNFNVINIQGYVNASISGQVDIDKVPSTTPITLQIYCPNTIGVDGKPINTTATSNTTGGFNVTFQAIGENDKAINCSVTFPGSTEYEQETQNVTLSPPTFKSSGIVMPGEYNQVLLTIKGTVTDAANLVPAVQKANVTLILNSTDPLSNNLTTLTDASGNYQFNFSGVAGQIYNATINVTDSPQFNSSSTPIKLDCTKNATLMQNIQLQRSIYTVNLSSSFLNVSKLPIQNVTVSVSSQTPMVINNSLLSETTTDSPNGSFVLPIKCYQDLNTSVVLNISIPTYQPIIQEEQFNCSQPILLLAPIILTPQKINVTSTITGKLIGPAGQYVSNQQVILVTNPQSVNLTNKTGVDGSFEFVNQYTQPNTNYSFELFVLNGLNQNQTWSVNGTPVNNASSFAFGTLNLQQLVNASISGQVDVNNVTDTTPVVLQVSCPSTLGADGKPINTTVTSNTTGGFNLSFGVLAENDKPVNCSVTYPGSTEYAQKQINVTLSPPTFKSSGILLPGEYNQVLLTIKGTVTDAANLVPAVQKANVTLILNSTDPLSNNLTTLTDASGNYQFNFSGVAGQIYNATINVTDSPQFNSSSTPIKLDCTKNATIQQNVVLQREILEATFLSQLVNELKQPIVNATLTLTSESPNLPPALALQSSVKDQANGSFALPFKCYADVNTTLSLTIQIPTYDNVNYQTQPFNCQNQSFSLQQLSVTPLKTNVTSIVFGKIIDPSGSPVGNLVVNLTTFPSTTSISNKTLVDGTFMLVNQFTQPNQSYLFQLSFINEEKQIQSFNLTGTPVANVSNFTYGLLNMQGYVNASISGQVDVNKVPATTPITLEVFCPNTTGADGKPINTTVTTNATGGFNLTFQAIAENDKAINCSVIFPGSTGYAQETINVTLLPPTFKSSGIVMPGEYNQVLLTIKGTVTDAANLVPAVQKANVTLILNSTDPLSNNLTTLTDASGNYQFNFSGVAGQIYNATINVTDSPQFNSSSTPIKLDCTKNATIQQNVVLQREILEATFLSQLVNELKQPIVNATLTLTSESPSLQPAPALQSSIKDQANGSFALPFKCYADVNTTLTVTIQIPTYDNVVYQTQPFNCQNQSFSLQQLSVTPLKTNVTSIILGKLVDPQGQAVGNLQVNLTTNPTTIFLSNKTLSDGTFVFVNQFTQPNESFVFQLSFINGEKQNQTFNLTGTPVANISTFTFGQLSEQGLVNASISGQVDVNKVPATTPITLQVYCPNTTGADGKPINTTVTTNATGGFNLTFQAIAENDKAINCSVIFPGSTGYAQETINVTLLPPTFKSSGIVMPGEYNQVLLTIKGTVTDAANLVPAVQKANVTLILNSTDPLSNNLTTLTDASGNYQFNFSGVAGQIYNATINVTDSPQFNSSSTPIKLDCTKNATIQQNVVLQREILEATFLSQLVNELKQPIVNATLTLTSESPSLPPALTLQSSVKDQANGSFALPFKCFADVNTTLTVTIQIPTYDNVVYQTQPFNCQNQSFSLQQLSVTPSKTNVTSVVTGKIVDPTGTPFGNQQVVLITNPQTVSLTNKTLADGTFEFVNQYTQPQQSYQFQLSFVNGERLNQTFNLTGTPVANISTFTFGQLSEQGLVNASISGQVDVNKVPATTPVTLQVYCPNTTGADGKPINTTVTTNATGGFNLTFQAIAENDKAINCSVIFPGSTGYAQETINVTLLPPTFKSSGIVMPGEYNQVLLTIKGTVTDAANLVPAVQKANVTLILNSTDPLSNNLTTLTDASGNYQFNFSGVAGQIYNATINVADSPQFMSQIDQVQLDCTKNGTLVRNILLYRSLVQSNLVSSLIDQQKQPIQNAVINLIAENPSLNSTQFLASSIKDSSNGQFSLPFKCYDYINTTLNLSIAIPTYENILLSTTPLNCSGQDITYPPIQVTPLKINVTSTIQGKLVGPNGQPVPNIDLNLMTQPATSTLYSKSGADGSFTFVDPFTQPNQPYTFDLTFQNQLKVNQSFKITGTPVSNTSVFNFGTIDVQQFVTASVTGQVDLSGKQDTTPITLQIICPNTLGQDGKPINTTVTTNSQGQYSVSYQALAENDKPINCTIIFPQSSTYQQVSVNVSLPPPTFKATAPTIEGAYNQIVVILKGTVSDATKLTTTLAKAVVQLNLTTPDPLQNTLTAVTDGSGAYQITFNGVQDQVYQALLSASDSPDFVIQTQSIKIDCSKSTTITTDFQLQRTLFNTTIESTLVDIKKQPFDNVVIKVLSTVPEMSIPTDYTQSATTSGSGAFSIPFQCYQDYKYSMTLVGQIGSKAPIKLDPFDFNCSQKVTQIPTITLYTTIDVTIQGEVLNALNKPQSGLSIKLPSQNQDFKTDKDGKYSFLLKLDRNTQYPLEFEFNNDLGQQQTFSQTIKTTNDADQSFTLQDIYYQTLVSVDLQGTLGSGQFRDAQVALDASVNGTNDKSGSSIKISSETSATGTFDFKFKLLAQLQQYYAVEFSVKPSDQFDAGKFTQILIPPVFTVSGIFVTMNETKAFQDQINKFYSKFFIIGQTDCQYDCTNDPLRPVSDVQFKLERWDGSKYLDLGVTGSSDSNGIFKQEVEILKSQLSVTFAIAFSKKDLIGYSVYFVPESALQIQEGQQYIDLGIIRLQNMGKPLPCPAGGLQINFQSWKYKEFGIKEQDKKLPDLNLKKHLRQEQFKDRQQDQDV